MTAQILASLLKQLIEQSDKVFLYIEQGLYANHLKTKTTPKQSELLKGLQGAVGLCSRVFIAIDALDELEEQVRDDIVTALQSLQQSLFMTSRPIPLSTFSGLEMKIEAPAEDFQKLITTKMSHVSRLKWLLNNPPRAQLVIDQVEKKSKGM